MFKEEMTYGYGDVCILDAITSDVEHRSECNTKRTECCRYSQHQ